MFQTIRPRTILIAALACAAATLTATAQDTATSQPAATPPARTDLPPAKTILDRAIDAMGGRKAFEGIESTRMKGNMSTPMGDMALEMLSASDKRFLIKQSFPGVGDITIGCDGDVGWMNHPMMGGMSLIEDAQLEDMEGQANMYELVMRFEDTYPTMTVVDQTTFGDAECYKVHMVKDEQDSQDVYFNVESGLVSGVESTQDNGMGMGEVSVIVKFSDWKQFGDIKGFTRMAVEQMGMTMDMTFTDVAINDVDLAVFELPEDIKKLVAERDAAATAAPTSRPE